MNFGSGAGKGEASGMALATGKAKAGNGAKFGVAKSALAGGWNKPSLTVGAAEKSAATLRSTDWLTGTASCALAAYPVPSIRNATASCLFMVLPSEVRPHAWNRPLCYGKQDRGPLSTFFR